MKPIDSSLNPLALFEAVSRGELSPDDAAAHLERVQAPAVAELGFATVDLDRARRRGQPEVIFGEGKTPDHIAGIARAMFERGQRVLATRITAEAAAEVMPQLDDLPARYEAQARCLLVEAHPPAPVGRGPILVVSAGTSDLPVASEARCTAQAFGHTVEQITDVGVAGLHRLLRHVERLRQASVIIVCAGMEGALPGVVAGLVACPVIGVPTSVGYGIGGKGVSALLTMLNACAAGLTVVNIDNGFGAAYAASLIDRAAEGSADE